MKEKRLQQSLDKLNSRLRDNGPGGSKPGSVTNKVYMLYACHM